MANRDNQETLKEEEAIAYSVILKNCYKFHPDEPMPEYPWFLEYKNKSKTILENLARETGFDHKKFARKASKILMGYKAKKVDYDIKRALLLRESIDIDEALKTITEDTVDIPTSLEVKNIKAQSNEGPIKLKIFVNRNGKEISEGDKIDFLINFNESIVILFILDDGNENSKEIDIFFII